MRLRKTARAVLLDPADRVLLFEFVMPPNFISSTRHFWATPGGAIDPVEDVLDAVVRELREETGIDGVDIGAELWFGSNRIVLNGEPVQTLERFFHVRSPTTELGATNWTDLEKQIMHAHRWWTVPELIAAKETIFPPRFGYLVEHFLAHGSTGPQEIAL